MQTNNLYSFFADPDALTFHDAMGDPVAQVTIDGVELRTDALRAVEIDHLQEVAADFGRFHGLVFDGENYGKQLMPLVKP